MPRILFLMTFAFVLRASCADRVFESGPQKTHLLELFTSEGCSSCPPAEAWLSKLKAEPGLWKDFAPVAFHVDYWDRLGWRDPFASRQWTQRQYDYSASWKSESVYTPGFVLDGREWQSRKVPSAGNEKPGVLKLSIAGNNKVAIDFNSTTGKHDGNLEVHLASLGFDLSSRVTAGENNGRSLRHDFVALSLTSEKLVDGKAELQLAAGQPAKAIVAWVTNAGQVEPVQAVGGWLP